MHGCACVDMLFLICRSFHSHVFMGIVIGKVEWIRTLTCITCFNTHFRLLRDNFLPCSSHTTHSSAHFYFCFCCSVSFLVFIPFIFILFLHSFFDFLPHLQTCCCWCWFFSLSLCTCTALFSFFLTPPQLCACHTERESEEELYKTAGWMNFACLHAYQMPLMRTNSTPMLINFIVYMEHYHAMRCHMYTRAQIEWRKLSDCVSEWTGEEEEKKILIQK